MSLPTTVDLKLCFKQYSCRPGYAGWEAFQKELLRHAGKTDSHGWSLADHFLGRDDGGPHGANPAPLPMANADQREALRTAVGAALGRCRAEYSPTVDLA